jgi:hypothetical protein
MGKQCGWDLGNANTYLLVAPRAFHGQLQRFDLSHLLHVVLFKPYSSPGTHGELRF